MRVSRITGVLVALATTAAVLCGSSVGAPLPAAASTADPATELPREINGGVELTLADGDLLRVWASKDYRTVWAKRRDVAAGEWGQRQVVLRKKHLFCGAVKARTANGAVAVLAECDRYGYAEDQAPVASRAIWSADAVTWTPYALTGESYEEPGISPDGTNAVWPQGEGYVTRTAGGFMAHELATPGQEYTATATITDTAQVSYLYGAQLGRRCRLVVLTRTDDAAPTHQELALVDGCIDADFVNVDADTAWFGDTTDPAFRSVISRPDATSPWAVSQIAPASAPGLRGSVHGLDTDYVTAPGLSLFALGSTDRRTIRAQAYDPVAQSWGPPVVVHSAGARCSWGDNWLTPPLSVLVADLRCGGRHVVLTTQDGHGWRALRMGRHTWGLSPDGRFVAIPGRSESYVVSAERGVVTLPLPVTGRCDLVVPDGPDGAVLLTARGRHRGWPTVLQHSSPGRWTTLSHTRLPVFEPECRAVRPSTYDLPYRFDVSGGAKGYAVQIVRRGGEWTVRRSRY